VSSNWWAIGYLGGKKRKKLKKKSLNLRRREKSGEGKERSFWEGKNTLVSLGKRFFSAQGRGNIIQWGASNRPVNQNPKRGVLCWRGGGFRAGKPIRKKDSPHRKPGRGRKHYFFSHFFKSLLRKQEAFAN